MGLGLRAGQARQRRQRRLKIATWLAVLAGLVGLGYAAYLTGGELARLEVRRLEAEVTESATRLAGLEERNRALEAAAAEAKRAEQTWRQRYEADVPAGPVKDLLARLQARLATGVRPERLALVIDAATNQPVCDGTPATKRFIVRTPLYRGAHDVVSFADNAITVTAEGQSLQDGQGNPMAAFDPAAPITATFATLGGKASTAAGPLPLHHSVIWGGAEHRFSIVPGETRGFVNVTAERCRAP